MSSELLLRRSDAHELSIEQMIGDRQAWPFQMCPIHRSVSVSPVHILYRTMEPTAFVNTSRHSGTKRRDGFLQGCYPSINGRL